MRIRTLWEHGDDDDVMPWLVVACDEYTEEEHNGTPEFYQRELDKNTKNRRELEIHIPESAVRALFKVQSVEGKVTK